MLLGCEKYDHAVDVWALACVMVELMTKKQPFKGSSNIDCLLNIGRYLGTKSFKKVTVKNELSNVIPLV